MHQVMDVNMIITEHSKQLIFSIHLALPDDLKDTIKRNTTLTVDQFEDLLTIRLPSLTDLFQNASYAKSALYMYLMKMRTGLTRTAVDREIAKVREAMKTDFTNNNINYIRSREELIQVDTTMGRGLFCADDKLRVMIICGATYPCENSD